MTILMFGIAKDIAGTAELTLENENKTLTNVGALKNYLYDQYPVVPKNLSITKLQDT